MVLSVNEEMFCLLLGFQAGVKGLVILLLPNMHPSFLREMERALLANPKGYMRMIG